MSSEAQFGERERRAGAVFRPFVSALSFDQSVEKLLPVDQTGILLLRQTLKKGSGTNSAQHPSGHLAIGSRPLF